MNKTMLAFHFALAPPHLCWLRAVGGAALIVLLALAGTGTAHAQTAEDALRFTERAPATGARMMGLSGAGIAGVADYAALYTNPAGLGYVQTSQAAGAFGLSLTQDESLFRAPLLDADGNEITSPADATASDYGGNANLVYRFPTSRGSLVFAAGYNQVNFFKSELAFEGTNAGSSITDIFLPGVGAYGFDDNGVPVPDSDLSFVAYEAGAVEFLPDEDEAGNYPFYQAVAPGTLIEQQGTVTREGRLSEVNLGGAVEAGRGFMVGLSVNISSGIYTFDNFYTETDINNENTPDLYSVVFTDGTELAGFDELQFSERTESELTGGNLRGGFSAEVAPGVRAGLTLETPTFYQINETFTVAEITTFFDEGGSLSYGDQPGDVGRGTFEYEIRTPWRLGAGLSVNTLALTDGTADLTLLGDVEIVDWSQLELDSESFDFSGANRSIDNYKVVANMRLGAEYRQDAFTLRGGFAYQPDPRGFEVELAGGERSDRSKTFLSAGVGYQVNEQVRLDLGWMQERFDDQYVPYGSYGGFDVPGGDEGVLPSVVDEAMVRNQFLLGLSYSF